MKEKIKKFLFEVVTDGKIVNFTKTSLDLEFGDREIQITWEQGDPEEVEFKYKNLHHGTTRALSGSISATSYTTSSVVFTDVTSRIYSITVNGLTYQVPMTIPESDNLTALLSEAFVVYQTAVLEQMFVDFETYKSERESCPFDKILE
jgi:hypothetical protein